MCPCAGCVIYETSEHTHCVEVSDELRGYSASYMTNGDTKRMKKTPLLITVEGLPCAWTKISDTSFQHKVVMIPGVAQIKDHNFKHDSSNLTTPNILSERKQVTPLCCTFPHVSTQLALTPIVVALTRFFIMCVHLPNLVMIAPTRTSHSNAPLSHLPDRVNATYAPTRYYQMKSWQ